MTQNIWSAHLSSTLASHGLAAYLWNETQDVMEWQGNLHAMIGIAAQDYPATGKGLYQFINPQDIPARLSALHQAIEGQEFSIQYRLRRANGMQIDITETGIVQRDPGTGDRIVCGTLKIADAQQYAASAAKSIIQPGTQCDFTAHDTGMTHYGRLMLCQKINEWVESDQDTTRPTFGYLLVVGIDRLSMFNEAFGSSFTDELITMTGKRLRHMVSDAGSVARIDGDVFAVFFHNAPHAEMAAVAHHIIHSFNESPLQTARGPVGIGVSVGGVIIHRQCKDPADMLTKAEMAMQSAKERGRGRFISYNEAAGEAASTRLLLSSGDAFLRALKNDRVRLAYQPVINSRTQGVSFHESLIRFFDDDGKIHSAASFIPAIEKMGLSRLLDRHAMRMAVEELSIYSDLELSVNVSNLTLTDPDWLRGLVGALRDREGIASRLIIEITESAVMHDVRQTIRLVKTLRDLGCRVALDDFGSGYTAFSQIKDLDINLVKIDKSFIRGIGEKENHLFVRTLHTLANGVDVETVGEGAETMADAKLLTDDGIHHIQGYVFGFPTVERVWLPKGHADRKIGISPMPEPGAAAVPSTEEMIQG